MSQAMVKDTEGLGGVIGLYSEETETGAANGTWIEFPLNCKLSVIIVSTGTAKVQVTNAKLSDVQADTVPVGAIADWDLGAVAAGQSEIAVCSAYRLVSASGDSEMYGYATKLSE